jgi:hypothetical protein
MFLTTPFRALLGAGLFQNGAARDHDVAAGAVHLEDLEGLRRAHERPDVAHRANVHLAAGQKGDGAGEVDGEAALDPPEDHAGHPLVLFEGLFQLHPGFLALGLFARQHGLAVLVLDALEEHLDLVARDQLRGLSALGEFLEGDAAFGLEAHVDHRHVAFYGDHGALEDRALEAFDLAEGLVEQVGEAFLAQIGRRSGFRG